MSAEVQIKVSPEVEAAILAHLDAARRYPAIVAVENMLREIQAGNVEVVESEVQAPPAADGEATIEFKFRLRAKDCEPTSQVEGVLLVAERPDAAGVVYSADALRKMADGTTTFWDESRQSLLYRGPTPPSAG